MAETDIEFEFKRQLKKLKQFQGSGTQLVSVYIPAGAQIHETAGKLREEMSQASNIKSKQTRTNVTDTLEKILQHFLFQHLRLGRMNCLYLAVCH